MFVGFSFRIQLKLDVNDTMKIVASSETHGQLVWVGENKPGKLLMLQFFSEFTSSYPLSQLIVPGSAQIKLKQWLKGFSL